MTLGASVAVIWDEELNLRLPIRSNCHVSGHYRRRGHEFGGRHTLKPTLSLRDAKTWHGKFLMSKSLPKIRSTFDVITQQQTL